MMLDCGSSVPERSHRLTRGGTMHTRALALVCGVRERWKTEIVTLFFPVYVEIEET
jgi:hypothetical protein